MTRTLPTSGRFLLAGIAAVGLLAAASAPARAADRGVLATIAAADHEVAAARELQAQRQILRASADELAALDALEARIAGKGATSITETVGGLHVAVEITPTKDGCARLDLRLSRDGNRFNAVRGSGLRCTGADGRVVVADAPLGR